MNESQRIRLQELIDHGYEFNFGDYIGKGFDIFKENILGFAGYFFVYFMIIMIGSFIPIVGSLAVSLISLPLLGGIYIVANKIEKNTEHEFGDFFRGFDYFGPLALIAIISGLIYILLLSPIFIGAFGYLMTGAIDPDSAVEVFEGMYSSLGWLFILFIPIIYLSIAWSWAPLFVIFYDMGFWEAMEMSRKIITKKWLIIFLFSMVVGIIASLGVIGLFIGIFFTVPLGYIMSYSAFSEVTMLLDETDNDIVDHLVK